MSLEANKKKKGYVDKLNKDTFFNYKLTKTDGVHERKEEHDPERMTTSLGFVQSSLTRGQR
jgi:hypothetical protein